MVALTLHPAARRKLMAKLPHDEAHDIALRPLGGGGAATMIATAGEQSYIEAVLEDLKQPDWRAAILSRQGLRRGAGDGVLELAQPVHRRFHMALFEAYCRTPGSPRLDPRKIAGMGLVLRRQLGESIGSGRLKIGAGHDLRDAIEQEGFEGWMNDGPTRRGWLRIAAPDLDPDPTAQNRRRALSAARSIETMIAVRKGERRLVEQVLPLFVAPPEVCEAMGRTVLYGLIPVASPDLSDAPPPPPDYANLAEAGEMRRHLSAYLKARPGLELPRAGERLDPAWRPLQAPPPLDASDGEPLTDNADGRLYSFGIFLQQLMIELGAFEPGGPAEELMRLLGQIDLPTARNGYGETTASVNAADFVRAAAPILIGGEPNDGGVHMPLEWPAVGDDVGPRLTDAALACLASRFSQLAPKTPKFHGDSQRYAIRGFLRVRMDPACPARLVWSNYSEPFRILPWWHSEGPAARIALPSLGKLKGMKPNVAFELPPEIANLVAGDPKKLSDGEGSTGGIDIFWLCSFSLPAITLCAFIVLSIFLGLLNLIFGWMAWIKICIPIPRPK